MRLAGARGAAVERGQPAVGHHARTKLTLRPPAPRLRPADVPPGGIEASAAASCALVGGLGLGVGGGYGRAILQDGP